MAQKKSRPVKTRNGIPLTRDEYRQLKRQKEREERRKRQEAWDPWICRFCCWPCCCWPSD